MTYGLNQSGVLGAVSVLGTILLLVLFAVISLVSHFSR